MGLRTIKIAVCDDMANHNTQFIDMLTSYMKRNQINNFKIDEYTSGIELLDKYRNNLYDFIFLDVEMPGLDGFETAERIRCTDLKTDIIFVTRDVGQVHMGYSYNAKGYIYKPVCEKKLDDLMSRLIEQLRRNIGGELYSVKLKGSERKTANLLLKDILYFESVLQDINAVTVDKKFTFRGKMPDVAADLRGKGFITTHKSFLVNMYHIFTVIDKKVILKEELGGQEIPISKSQTKAVKQAFDIYKR